MYGVEPPITVAVAFPLQFPPVSPTVETETVNAVVSVVMIKETVSVRLVESVTTTLYIPEQRESAKVPFPPFDHEYEYGAVPPVAVAVAFPLQPLVAFVFDTVKVSCAKASLKQNSIKATEEIKRKIFFMVEVFEFIY